MYNYSIMPIIMEHFDEMCADIKEQYKSGVTTCPLFSMTLVPEGDPVWDKAGDLCEKYAKFRDKLESDGVPSGILIQASLGHGYDISLAPFTRYLGVTDGVERSFYCPYDKDFQAHFKGVMKKLASERPKAIMLDDDFRIMLRPGNGCACKLHMAEFERRTGKKWTREQMWEHIETHPSDDPLTKTFIDMQTDSLVEAIKVFREGIDEVDPTIQGINCKSGDMICDSLNSTAPHFAGKGNPIMVRVSGGTYAPRSTREFSDIMRRTAICATKLKKAGIDILLAETDTIPFNRYGKNARYLHSQFTSAILEGTRGAKHWITRTYAWEPKSGKAFRDILAKHKDLYERLTELADGIKWVGANSAIVIHDKYDYKAKNLGKYQNCWATKCFERIGLPFYFAEPDDNCKLTFLEDTIVSYMTDEQIKSAFSGTVCMTYEAANDLCSRGYGDFLGVNIKEWEDVKPKGEYFEFDTSATCTAQKNRRILEIVNDKVEVLSYLYKLVDNKKMPISPAVTLLDRGNGKYTVVFAGTPNAEHNYMEGFAFLNESRKRQFIDIFSRSNALPVYYDGDEEVLLRAGFIKDGRLLATFFNLGYDPLDELDLVLDSTPKKIEYLDPEGNEINLDFVLSDNGKIKVKSELLPMYPLLLLISF